jgi:hypothetical protein
MKHGHKENYKTSPTYQSWSHMKTRCQNPNCLAYKYYGGRGITVCNAWQKFENFFADMGERPEGLTLDRRDNDGNYEPGNCKWSTKKEQQNNRRKSKPITCGPCPQCWFFACNENTREWDEDNSQSEFASRHGLDQGGISRCLNKKQKQTKGWRFWRVG